MRPSVGRGAPATALPQQMLEDTADAALLVQPAEGSPSLQLSIRSELFAGLRCSIAAAPEGVTATFYAEDVSTRRLLEAEAGKLRNLLTARGLRVEAIRVVPADEAGEEAQLWLAAAAAPPP